MPKLTELTREEEKVMAWIFGILPEKQRDFLIALGREFGGNEIKEAKFANAMDRFMPVLQNLFNNGQNWRENNISKEQVLKNASCIAFGSQFLWERMSREIADFDL